MIIMKRHSLILTVLLCCSLMCDAGVFSARSAIELAKHKTTILKQGRLTTDESLEAFVCVKSDDVLERLLETGVTINSRFGNIVTVSVPIDCIGRMLMIEGVERIELARHLTLCNDKARELSRFPLASFDYEGYTNPVYTGRGVVVGMIDAGMDFNHINFMDKDGNNRIVRVYMPCDTTGTAPVIDGMSLPGSEYTTPEQIRLLTTDDTTMMHSTHTTGTAAGSYMENGYNGVATGAQIVSCVMPENGLTDINIANSIKYIFNYADKMGLPAVINMSLGSNDGAHDGTSTLCCLFNEMTGPGRICVVSAGNDGHIPMNIRKQLSDNDSLATFISNWTSREPLRGYTSMWSQSPNRHTVDIVIWDIKSDTIVHRLDIPRDAATDSVYIVSSETDSIFAKYFTGALYFACAIESNGNFHSLVEVDYTSTDKSKYRIGLINKAPSGETLMGWSGGKIVFSSSGLSSWVGGVAGGCCISDLATTDSVISVGAYCSNNSFVMMSGDTLTVSRCYPYDIAYFSSFGPDALNKPRPDVVAPGYQVASSVSRYVSAYQDPAIVVDNVIVNGVEYPYGLEGGTSMSTPVVTGAIALWLEINKSLSPSNIREILQATCYKDSYVENGVPKKWGYGKLDIDAGIKYLLEKLNGDVNCDGEVNSSDITCLYNILLGISNDHISRGDVNADGSITSSDITFLYSNILGF